jgi:hypothetical protein
MVDGDTFEILERIGKGYVLLVLFGKFKRNKVLARFNVLRL